MRLFVAAFLSLLICAVPVAAQDPAQQTTFTHGLTVYPIGTAFGGIAGGPVIGPVTIDVTPTVQTALWSATSNVPWLTATASVSSGPGKVALTVNPETMPAGTHTGSFVLYTSSTTPLVSIPVVVTLIAAPPQPPAPAPLPEGVHLTVRDPLSVRVTRRAGNTSTQVFITVNGNEFLTVNGTVCTSVLPGTTGSCP